MNDTVTTLLTFLLVGTIVGIPMWSCEEEEVRIPFGYDPTFNYLEVLRSSPPYSYESTEGYQEFKYQAPEQDSLTKLRTLYNFDNVAGNGTEMDRILNLFTWVHNTIKHDGSNSAPDPENSLSILDYCSKSGAGVNCVYMAIVFNEACLAMGIKARVIHGNAKKFIFNGEWHTFNAVYSSDQDKWIFMDPMKYAYFTDEDNTPLSISELRDHLIRGETLHLNPDANYNGSPFEKDEYLNYLSKNLYRFSCSVESKFGNYGIFHLTGVARDYVHLDPAGEKQDGLALGTNIFTSNPDYFWASPF